jgi:phage gp36-like protein
VPYTTFTSFIDRYGASFFLGAINDRITGITVSELESYVEGDPSPSQGVKDAESIFEDVRADVEADIDAYLGTVLDLPLVQVPRSVEGKANALIAYELVKSPSLWLTQERKHAIDWLRDVARGVVTLGTDTSGDAVDSNQLARSTGRSDAASNVMTDTQRKRFEGGGYDY